MITQNLGDSRMESVEASGSASLGSVSSETVVSYDYGIARVMPRVERGEFINVGVILFCRTQAFLAAKTRFDVDRLLALDPQMDADAMERVEQRVLLMPRICSGEGPIGALDQAERFHWLVAYRSAMIQVSPVHSGICTDPETELARLFRMLV